MNFFITGSFIFIKQILSSKRYIAAILIIPFIILFLCLIIPENDYKNIYVGIAYSDKSSISNSVVSILTESENFKYNFYDFSNINEMERNIASNKLHIGYIFPDDIDDAINERSFKDIIIKLKSPASYLSAITDEVICSAIIQVLSPYYADNFFYESNLINYNDGIINYLIDGTSEYLKNGDIMKFEAYETHGQEAADFSKLDDNVFIFACLSLALCILANNLLISSFNSDYNNRLFNYYKSSGKRDYIIKLCYYSALSVISIFYTFISLLILTFFLDISESLYYSAFIMIFCFIIFVAGLCNFITRYNIFGKIMHLVLPLYLFGNFIFSGFLISTKNLGNVIDMISYTFAAKYFVNGLTNLGLFNPAVLFAAGILLFIDGKQILTNHRI